MWCSTCQQDVPALGSPSNGGDVRCGKCGERLLAASAAPPAREPIAVASNEPVVASDEPAIRKFLTSGPLAEDDWALEAELRGVQRLIGSLKSRSTIVAEPVAVHEVHAAPAPWHAGGPGNVTARHALNQTVNAIPRSRHATEGVPDRVGSANTEQPRGHVIAWLILSLGLAVFACGVVLLGWSLIGGRADLWPVGLPLTLVGQAGLILGLILQLDGLWQTSRKTEAALCELDGELRNVRRVTTLLMKDG